MELADILNNNPGIVPFSAVTGAAQDLIPTSVQSAAYTAVAGNAVPVDASSASVTITLPTAPADRSRVAVKMIAVSGSFATTINTGSGDALNKAGGSTSATLSLLNQGLIFQYAASTKIWIVYAGDVPLSQLDARYATIASPSFTGTVKFPDGVVTQASTGQLLFGTSSSALYLFSGTNGLIVNNQANTTPLLTLTNAGALTLSGNASFNGVNITAATNPALNYGGSLFLTRTAAGTVAVGTTQGGTDGNVIAKVNGNVISTGTGTLTLGTHTVVATGAGALTVDGSAVVSSVNGNTGTVTGAQAVAGANIAPNSVLVAANGWIGANGTPLYLDANAATQVSGTLGLTIRSGLGYRFTNAVNSFQGVDSGLFRTAPATVAIGNGSPGDASGTLQLANLIASGPCKLGSYTVATLPSASSYSGYTTTVSNPASGKRADVLSDGTNWRYSDNSIAA